MAGEAAASVELGQAVALLAAGVIAVPLFRRLGLGSVLGYLAAGLAIGPFGLKLVSDPETLLHIAELGVVMFLFLIGLEMRPSKLWALRREIFGLGLAQVVTCSALLTGVGIVFGLPPVVAMIGAMGFVLSSTAVIMKMLDERGETALPSGQRAVSILLLEDLAIVPLLALVAVLGTVLGTATGGEDRPAWMSVGIALGAIAGLLVAGRYLLDPMFRILAKYGGREVMTAGALLVVLGAALFMQVGGLSMAMGAFLAGVLLSESSFRHELEADVEPFRGILLGLFFLSVGMSLDLAVVAAEWQMILGGVLAFMLVKGIGIYGIARAFKADHNEAINRATLFAQGGEFAFVLYAAALAAGLFEPRIAAVMSALVILSMALTPIVMIVAGRFLPKPAVSMDGVDEAVDLKGRVVIIGFGRFAQVVSQPLLAKNVDISIIESEVEMIQAAAQFGFKVYFGDGTRLDVLRASGCETAEMILVCVDKPEAADKIVELCKSEFSHAKVFARAYDRGHALRLVEAGVDFHMRETFESAFAFGREVLIGLGETEGEADEVMAEVRRRDSERFTLQRVGGLAAGMSLLRGNMTTPVPTPLVVPARKGKALNEEAADVIGGGDAPEPAR